MKLTVCLLALVCSACFSGSSQSPASTEQAVVPTLVGEATPEVPTLQVGPVGQLPNPNTVPVPEPNSCHMRDGLPDRKCTPGVLNPNVSLVDGELLIRVPNGSTLRVCSKEFSTRMIRPPTSYTNVLKERLLGSYGFGKGTRLADFELDHDVALEDLGHPWSPMNLWPEPRAGTANAIEKDGAEANVHTRICADQPHAFMYAAQLAQDWRPFSRKPVGATSEPASEPEPKGAIPVMLITLFVILLVLSVLWGGAGAPRYWPASGYWGAWTPLGFLIVLVVILLLVAPNTVFGEPLPASSYTVVSLLFGSVLLTANVTEPEQDPDTPPGLPFWLAWWIGWVMSVLLLIIGSLQTAFAAGNGEALGMDTRAIVLLGIASSVLGFTRGFFPNGQHSPGNRNKLLSRVLRGHFPRDAKVVEPSKAPLDTL